MPESARELRLEVEPDLRALEQTAYDPETDTTSVTPLDPATQADRRGLSSAVVVRDATGSLYRFSGAMGTLGAGRQVLTVPLGDGADAARSFATPLDLVAIELGVTLPADVAATDASGHRPLVDGHGAGWGGRARAGPAGPRGRLAADLVGLRRAARGGPDPGR